jgi:YVTN family beta-propeller protein
MYNIMMSFKKSIYIGIATIVSFFLLASSASAATYYFANLVSTDPTELGNYCNDEGCTDPATQLPNFAVDEVFIGSENTFDGDLILNGAAIVGTGATITGDLFFRSTYYGGVQQENSKITLTGSEVWDFVVQGDVYDANDVLVTEFEFFDDSFNSGRVPANAVFYGEGSVNSGIVTGIKTRVYTQDVSPGGDFSGWVIVADGCVVDLTNASLAGATTQTRNGGSFIYPEVSLLTINGFKSTVTLHYSLALDESSVPAISDFVITVNGVPRSMTNIVVDGADVVLTLSTPLALSDSVVLTYTPGEDPIQVAEGFSVESLSNQKVYVGIVVGLNPFEVVHVNGKLYTINTNSDSVSVIDPEINEVIETIEVGGSPQYTYYSVIGDYLYVSNSASDSISVIDTNTDTVISTINVGDLPFYALPLGKKLYVANARDGTVSVVDTETNTVSTTLSVGASAYFVASLGTMVYSVNPGSNTVSVIDSDTDTIIDTITVGGEPKYVAFAGSKMYVTNSASDTLSVVNTVSNNVIGTINVGDRPEYIGLVGTKLYVMNLFSETLSVIDIASDTVIGAIPIGSPLGDGLEYAYFTIDGIYIYIVNPGDDTVMIVDTTTDTVVDTIDVGDAPYQTILFEGTAYTVNIYSNSVSVFQANAVPSQLPALTHFSTTKTSGSYATSTSIPITAHFNQTLASGSIMTLKLSTGATVTLNSRSGNTLSGTYIIGAGDFTADLFVRQIIAPTSVSDGTHTRTSYDIPLSVGDFEGENSFIARNLGDAKNISINITPETIDVGSSPYQLSSTIGGFIYVANQGSNDVSVVNLTTGEVVDTIDVGEEPYGLANVGTKLYVANTNSDDVSVIDSTTNTVTETIDVGVKPYYVATVGTKVYVTNGASNTVSVIDSTTDSVIETIPVGSYPRGIKAYGTDLYVANYGDPNYSGGNYISVIDSLTDTVSDTIILPAGVDGPRGVNVLSTKVYVTGFRSNNVVVIDPATNTVVDVIDVGVGPRGIAGTGTTLYVENFDASTISVIDTNTNTVTETIDVGSSPSGITIIGTDAYITSFQDNRVYKLNTTTNDLYSSAFNENEEEEEEPPTPTQTSSGGGGGAIHNFIVADEVVTCPPGHLFSVTTGKKCTTTLSCPYDTSITIHSFIYTRYPRTHPHPQTWYVRS